jgi:hypothetical protein
MSVLTFPPEILDLFLDELALDIGDRRSRAALLACTLVNRPFYYRASSHLFSSISISTHRSPERLNTLLDILITHPDLALRIRSFTLESLRKRLDSTGCLSAVFRRLYHLQKFGWTGNFAMPDETTITAITSSIFPSLCNSPYLTVLHLESIRNFPLSFFSACRHLESLTLIRVLFAKIGPETRSESLFSSLRRLYISGGGLWQRDMGAIRIIMTRAAPSLTTLILSQTRLNDCRYGNILIPTIVYHSIASRFLLKLNSTVFPVLKSIQISCVIYNGSLPTFIPQYLNYSAPVINQIQIKFSWAFRRFINPDQLAQGWSPIDETLSSPKYPALKTVDVTFSEESDPVSSELKVRTFLNQILPVTRSETGVKIRATSELNSGMEIHFVF